MEQNGILARVSIGRNKAGDIAYIYQYDLLNEIGLEKDNFFTNQTIIKIGTILTINDEKFKVVEIQTTFYDHLVDMSNPAGFNLTGVGELLNYNFEIIYFVEKI